MECPENLWPKPNRSYFVWEYGKTPDAIIEIVSNNEGGEDSTKLKAYESMHIPYYVIFDPEQQLSDEVLRGYQLDQMQYRRMDQSLWFAGIELGVEIWEGVFEGHQDRWLRWRNSQGKVIPTGAELAASEAQRADQEAQRADRLEAKLRELGVDPAS